MCAVTDVRTPGWSGGKVTKQVNCFPGKPDVLNEVSQSHDGRNERVPNNCHLTSTCIPHTCTPTFRHTYDAHIHTITNQIIFKKTPDFLKQLLKFVRKLSHCTGMVLPFLSPAPTALKVGNIPEHAAHTCAWSMHLYKCCHLCCHKQKQTLYRVTGFC